MDDWIGFLVRKQAIDDSLMQGYLVKLWYDGTIEISKDGLTLARAQTDFSLSTFITVKIVLFASNIKVYVNNSMYIDIVDDTYKNGYIALISNASYASFDDVIVRTLSIYPDV